MDTLIKCANIERTPETAFAELLRRHVLPIVKESQGDFSATFGGPGQKSGIMKVLQSAARGQQIAGEDRRILRQLKLTYKGVQDDELLQRARQKDQNVRPVEVIERIIRKEDA